MKSLCIALAITAVVLATGDARASTTGVIKGQIKYGEMSGGWCPTSADCTGRRYLQSQYGTFQPLDSGKIYVFTYTPPPSVGIQIGVGSTDANGNYTIQWTNNTSTSTARLYFWGEHSGLKFSLKMENGLSPSFTSPTVTLISGTTTTSPQMLSELDFGDTLDGNAMIVYYASAMKAYRYGVSISSALLTSFTGVQFRGIYDNASSAFSNDCAGTCGSGGGKFVKLSPDFDFMHLIVGHEVGHVVSYLLKPYTTIGDYTYPITCNLGSCPPPSHFLDSASWQDVQWEEGFASFVAVAIMSSNQAHDTVFCSDAPLSNTCLDNDDRIEPSSGSSCDTTHNRAERAVIRYLWDIFDNHDDTPVYTDSMTNSLSAVYDGQASFATGTADRQVDEQLNSAKSNFDARDGHNGFDFRMNTGSSGLGDSFFQWFFNCGFDGNNTP